MQSIVSVILPCRNEAGNVGRVVKKAKRVLEELNVPYEIIVSDSSTDGSAEEALRKGAKVIRHNQEGYGIALRIGFEAAQGDILVMADADDTYDMRELPKLLDRIHNCDIVMTSRLKGTIKKNAMPSLHRYLGNPLLSFLFRAMFNTKVSDTHSGFRAIKKEAYKKLNPKTRGMEFASEMLILATRENMRIGEVPITYWPRRGESKLRSFNDGWKHLRFMLLFSPNWLFIIPGIIMFVLGLITTIRFYMGPVSIGEITLDLHPMFVASMTTIIGYSVLLMGVFAKSYAVNVLGTKDRLIDWVNSHLSLERGVTVGMLVFLIGLGLNANIWIQWASSGFGALTEIRSGILGMTLIILGIQSFFSAFFISVLGIKR